MTASSPNAAWRVVVTHKPSFVDHRGAALVKEWRHDGRKNVKKVRVGQLYEVAGTLTAADAQILADRLLTDPITQENAVFPADHVVAPAGARLAEIWPKKGVSDPVADTVKIAAGDLGLSGLAVVRSGQAYEFFGDAAPTDVRAFCEERLMNPLIQSVEVL